MGVWRRSTRRCKSIPSTTMPWLTKTSWFANAPTWRTPRKSTTSSRRSPTIGSRKRWPPRSSRPRRRVRPAAASSSTRIRSKHRPPANRDRHPRSGGFCRKWGDCTGFAPQYHEPARPSLFWTPCYNRISVPSESTSLSESAPVPHPSDPVEQLYAELEAKIREYRPKDDLTALQQAFRFASKYHEGQTRDSGEPYMAHPVLVAHILADMRMDVVAMETGLLHDVVEDTSVTVEQVRKEFGPEVARCVDGVTKLTKLDVFSAEDRQAESVRKMLLAMVEDIRVILVKLADRIHNMRTLGYLSPERRERIARETIEIYAPIAHRLGMGKVRGELEDLAFQHLEPDAYQEILGAIESKRHSNEEF